MKAIRYGTLCLLLIVAGALISPAWQAWADRTIPDVWDLISDDWEGESLEAWESVSGEDLSLVPGGGWQNSTGLAVTVGPHESYLYQGGLPRIEHGYFSFRFNPNSVSIPDQGSSIPQRSILIADVKGDESEPLVALWLRRPTGEGYKAYLAWWAEDGPQYDYSGGEFDLVDGWQQITLGYQVDEWVAVWVDGQLAREVETLTHQEDGGVLIEVGKANVSQANLPFGVLYYDDVAFQVPYIEDLWVDAVQGDDENDGLSQASPLRTVQRAAELAGPDTTVHILPGVYRETVRPAMSGSAAEPVRYLAQAGPGTVIIRGSGSAASLNWTRLSANTIGLPPGVNPGQIYYADLSAWELDEAPRFVVQLDAYHDRVERLPLAREPDWTVRTESRHHEFWWAAEGGWGVAGCDPTTDPDRHCDEPWRSLTQLTDPSNDVEPGGIEPGNLTSLGNLSGGTLVALDSRQGHYVYRRAIVHHDVSAGRVTVDEICEHDSGSGDPGLGWGSKYYVEGKPYLLDTPGEWWYDKTTRRLYLWPPQSTHPANLKLEISRRETGFVLSERSYILLDGLTLEFWDGSTVLGKNGFNGASYGNAVQNSTLRYANYGVYLGQGAGGPADKITDGFELVDSTLAHLDTYAIYLDTWWDHNSQADYFTHSGIVNTSIRNNELHHLGFRSDDSTAVGAVFKFADKVRFEGNHVHHVAHNGVQFSRSVIQSPDTYGFAPSEIKTGEILILDNLFEKSCQLGTDCGALKIWGDWPDHHVFRDVLVMRNVFRNVCAWSYVSEKRGRWSAGRVRGMGGYGLYVDMASGLHIYRNIAYSNAHTAMLAFGVWRDGKIWYYNNILADSLYGLRLGGLPFDTHGSIDTQVVNNIIVNNEAHGIVISDEDGNYGNLIIDHNLYYENGWGEGIFQPGALYIYREGSLSEFYPTLADIQAGTPWEDHGQEGDPHFWEYDPSHRPICDGSWPDFHLTSDSLNAIDLGTDDLPGSLVQLLAQFGVADKWDGPALDIGRYEYAPLLRLDGKMGDQSVYLTWRANFDLAPGGVWQIAYQGPTGDQPSPVQVGEGVTPTRSFVLTGLTNYVPYTLSLRTETGVSAVSNPVVVTPTDHVLYLPAIFQILQTKW